jgi:hypothetical protein
MGPEENNLRVRTLGCIWRRWVNSSNIQIDLHSMYRISFCASCTMYCIVDSTYTRWSQKGCRVLCLSRSVQSKEVAVELWGGSPLSRTPDIPWWLVGGIPQVKGHDSQGWQSRQKLTQDQIWHSHVSTYFHSTSPHTHTHTPPHINPHHAIVPAPTLAAVLLTPVLTLCKQYC